MNILIVTAHPSSKGDTHTIATTYAEGKRAQGHAVEIVDLYAKEYEVPLFKFENIREFQISSVQKKFQEQIIWANEIVVVHPVWWSAPPAIMKNWLDLTIWPRVAYRYGPDGKVMKLLEGKTAKVFATSGGPSWYYYMPLVSPLKEFWQFCIFDFCGVDLVDFRVCGNLDKFLGEKREKHWAKFIAGIKKAGESR